ncbi:DUF2267 domain-containing protein [Streptomyces murinus]|uniref:hypothetical protein n=1 Tax=Streptomyces murinus TaxID=33900 RepID=UPI002E80C50C|nr:hypothetical protein [Streptomyces murinus]WUD04833.1 DUF2267 domain-containing protein [Streptomyces murinus]
MEWRPIWWATTARTWPPCSPAVADHGNEDVAEARREIDAVLPTLADAADHALLRRLLTQLPRGTPACSVARAPADRLDGRGEARAS